MQNFPRFDYALIALDKVGHMAHNLFHLLAEGKSIIFTSLQIACAPTATQAILHMIEQAFGRCLRNIAV